LTREQRFRAVGPGAEDQNAAADPGACIDEMVVRNGLIRMSGLTIGGRPVTAERLLQQRTSELPREMAAAVVDESHLSEEERKS